VAFDRFSSRKSTSALRLRRVGWGNAAGRLTGTLLSGVSYQLGGLPLCLATAGVMAAASWLVVRRIEPQAA